jgi:hypothetical protein
MIKFEHDGPQVSCRKTCYKRYDGANTPRWNLETKPFIVQWVIQKEETLVLRVIENHMPSWDVVGKGKCCQLVLKL